MLGCRAPSTAPSSDLDQVTLGTSRGSLVLAHRFLEASRSFSTPRKLLFQRLAPYGSDRPSPMDPQIAEIVKSDRGRQVTLCKEESLLSHNVVRCPRDQRHRAQEED